MAGTVTECGRPFIFKNKPVNVAIIQYSFDKGAEFGKEFQETILQTAIRLTWLIKQDTFFGLVIPTHN